MYTKRLNIIVKNLFFSNVERVKQEAIWNDESQRWRVPDLITQKTKLPPAGKSIHLRRTRNPFN